MENKKMFRSRISILMIIFIFTVFIPIAVIRFQEARYEEACILGIIFLLIILLFKSTHYVIAGDKLTIKIWFIRSGVQNIKDIASVQRSYNILASPAASLKRLRIDFVKGSYWLISPVREKEFIEELKAINPHIRINTPEKKAKWHILDWDF